MPDFDFLVSSDEALLQLDSEHLAPSTTLYIHNPEPNNASKIYVILPNAFSTSSLTSLLTHWYSTLNFTEGKEPELVILINAPTHFHSNTFKGFKHIHITDQKYQKNEGHENQAYTFEPITKSFYNARLIIENFTTEEGFIFSNQLKLLGKGEVSKSLGINLHGNNTLLELIGEEYPNQLVIDKLDITSDLKRLLLDKVLLKKILTLKQVDSLSVKKTTAYSNWQFGKVSHIDEFDLITAGKVTELFTDKAHITNLNCPKGKFYISVNSYIDFKVAKDQSLWGIELFIDMSGGLLPNKKVVFPAHRFNFDQITIMNADSVSMPYDGTCRQLLLQNCEKVQIEALLHESRDCQNI